MASSQLLNQEELDRHGKQRIMVVAVFVLSMGVALFASAGRLDWASGWSFFGLYLALVLAMGIWLMRSRPALVNERGRTGGNVKAWDKIIGVFFIPSFYGILIVAGLDARRGWSSLSSGWQVVGALGLVASMGLVWGAMGANAFLSTMVRIQNDRGHRVVTHGPYRFVRHPMYAGLLVYAVAAPLLLGSAWALIPGGALIATIIVRTALEDQTLQAELPGYREYAQQVRYRLIPGLW